MANGSRDIEPFGKLCIDENFLSSIQILRKFTLNTLFCQTIREYIVLNGFLRAVCLVHRQRGFFGSKDAAVIATFNRIIGNVLYDHGGFLLSNQPDHLGDEFLRIVSIHCKRIRTNTLQNFSHCAPC